MNIKTYLERIDYRGSLVPNVETLRALQLAHLLAVPFENLSIHAQQPIVLNDDALFEKIVGRRRGGFCYELNGLFAALLRALGFDVAMLSAGVAKDSSGFGPGFDHMTLRVEHPEHAAAAAKIAERVAGEVRTRCEVRVGVEVLAPGSLPKTEFKAKRVRDTRARS